MLVKAPSRAFRWNRMLESGEFATIAELAELERIALSYMTRVMRLTLLAPIEANRLWRSLNYECAARLGDRVAGPSGVGSASATTDAHTLPMADIRPPWSTSTPSKTDQQGQAIAAENLSMIGE